MRTLFSLLAASLLCVGADLRIVQNAVPSRPFTVAGERGALLGRQDGTFEAWQWPVKIFSGLRISAAIADYPVPIDVNKLATTIEVRPAETVITYSHAAFTIRQRMIAARGDSPRALPAIIVFEIESIRPLDLTFSFVPNLERMWPAPQFGIPGADWRGEGLYVLSTDDPSLSALVSMPGAGAGIMVPYQEHPQTYPLQFKLHYDPKTDAQKTFPLAFALRNKQETEAQAKQMLGSVNDLEAATKDYYLRFFDRRLIVDSPNPQLNEAAHWAEVAVDQSQVRFSDGSIGMVAGYYESADSARPGFAWYFGRDTLWTTYAINSYADYALTRRALDFLFSRQRSDGKVMHEFSQGAAFVDWSSRPYFYASADSTCLLIMAMQDYVATSGDFAYLQQHWDRVIKAYAFTRAHDTDGDGVYDNSQGTGWVESWPTGMPNQEIYLAALDEEASLAMQKLAAWMHDEASSKEAASTAHRIAQTITREYGTADGMYAFSHNGDGTRDNTATIYPAVAWWDGTYELENAGVMLSRWASAEFSTDWGTRDISQQTSFYDPISYHQGSVWPLFTGWVALAEYRSGRPLSAYAHLLQNVQLTWAQDLGAVTELLSGQFFQPLGRSTSHQMWSSAMVITPLLRGLFGLSWNAPSHTLSVAPSLPADWDNASLQHVPLGDLLLDLQFHREATHWTVTARANKDAPFCLQSGHISQTPCAHTIQIPVPPVELAFPASLPNPGSETAQLKALDERYSEHDATFTLAALGGSSYNLPVRLNQARVTVEGATLNPHQLSIRFPQRPGYQVIKVHFHW